jgi:toxin YoeB
MCLEFEPQALEDLRYWVEQDRRKAARVLRLLEECLRTPFAGSGKPEPLRHALAGCWSRRIDREHRLVYRVERNSLIVLACRFHY